jgi:hypothetical protein
MPSSVSHIACELKPNLIAVLDGRSTSRQWNGVIHVCLALASELLSRKSGARKLREHLGLSEEDLAYDCIADLFRRDEAGRFEQLSAYFASMVVEGLEANELLIALRRLVYSRVNHALFRLYHDSDPAFSRILRNVKIALDTLKQFDERDRFGESFIVPVLCETNEHLPPVDQSALESALLANATGSESVPVMMGKIAVFLREEEERSRLVSIMMVASVIKSVYEIKNRPRLASHEEMDLAGGEDTRMLIAETCGSVREEMRASYVGKKKVKPVEYEVYFRVIESSLVEKMEGMDGDATSYYDLLASHIPHLTSDEYRERHRARLEYLGLLVQKRLVTAIKRGT